MALIQTNEIGIKYVILNQGELDKLAVSLGTVSKEEADALAEMRKLNSEFKKFGSEGANAVKTTEKETSKFAGTLKGVGPLIAAAFSLAAIKSFGQEIIKTTAQYESLRKAIDFTSGSQKEGAQTFAFLTRLANKLGLELASVANAYKLFSASASQAGLTAGRIQDIFTSVAQATSVMGLSAQDTEGVMLALSQMMSKGTVSAEELRGQLGERLPGAFGLFAKAIGVTEQELGKMLQQGEVLAAETLPKFAAELNKVYGPEVAKGIDTLTAAQNRLSSAWDKFIETLGTRLGPAYRESLKSTADFLEATRQLFRSNEQQAKETEADIIANARERAKQQFAEKKAQLESLGIKKEDWEIAQELLQTKTKEVMAAYDVNRAMKGTDQNAARIVQMEKERIKVLSEIRDLAIADMQARNKGHEKTQEELKKQQEELKKQYNERLKFLELERQIRKLEGEIADNPNAALAADRAFYEAKKNLQENFANKGLDISNREILLTSLEQEKAAKELEQRHKGQLMDRYKADTQTDEEIFKARVNTLNEEAKEREKWMKENDRQQDELMKREEERIKFIAQMRQEAMQQALQLTQDLANGAFNILQAQYQNELAATNAKYDAEIRLADGNQQKINTIEEKRRAKEKEIRLKQFRADQAQAIANAVFAAAPFIIKYTAGLPITSANLALTVASLAAQTGFILAQPVPQFAKGVEDFEGGPAIVGEQGRELIRTSSGDYLSPNKPTLTYLPKGTDVITAPKTKEIMSMTNSYRRGQDRFVAIDTEPIAREISKLPVQSLHITERGLERYVQRGNRSTRILNSRRQDG